MSTTDTDPETDAETERSHETSIARRLLDEIEHRTGLAYSRGDRGRIRLWIPSPSDHTRDRLKAIADEYEYDLQEHGPEEEGEEEEEEEIEGTNAPTGDVRFEFIPARRE